jgi:2-polyprenyl-3-methyl-5-hydroxy-6-metoxy-1,4-benzoquinol methylase
VQRVRKALSRSALRLSRPLKQTGTQIAAADARRRPIEAGQQWSEQQAANAD